jgi:hypothetical protein
MTSRRTPANRNLAATGLAPVAESSAYVIAAETPAPPHPALLVIARSLARQAAAEWFRASLTADTAQETGNE